jgi:energy-coupling factor transporter ATP-binding protein EcfA2
VAHRAPRPGACYHRPLAPTRDPVDARYRDALAQRLRSVTVLRHIEGNDHGHSFGTLDLADLFVAPRFHTDRTIQREREELRELRARLAAPDLDPDERTASERRLTALEARHAWDPARGAYRHYTPQAHLFAAERSDDNDGSVRSGIAEPRHVLVRGDPGSGKSTLLQALALVAAGHAPTLAAGHPDLFGAVAGCFPVHLALADYATLDPRTTPPLRDHLRACAEAVHPGGAAELEAHLDAGTALLLLDGLDEIPTSDRRTRVVRTVEVLLAGLPPNNRCVISTRPEGGFPVAGTVERHLAPLDESQIRQLLINLLRAHAVRTGTSPDLRADVDVLLERLDRSQIDDLAHNPLLVTIIAASSLSSVTLPHDRIVLYHRILRTLIETWENARSLAHHDRKIPESHRWLVWGDVALSAHSSSPRSRDAWQHDVRVALDRHHPDADNHALASEYLDLATRHIGLLARRPSGELAFWHSTFGEYLAGHAVARDPRHLKQLRDDPRTVEIAAFALGYIASILNDRARAEALLRGLADDTLRPCEPLHTPALRYAAACLSRTPLTNSPLWDDLLVRLVDRHCLLPYAPNLTALAGFLHAYPERRLGAAASTVLLDRVVHPTAASSEISARALELLARDFTSARVIARCELVLADAHAHVDRVHPSALALFRAGRVRPDVCAALVQRDLFAAQDRDAPFVPTRFGRDVRACLDAPARSALTAQLADPDTAVPAALLLALVEPAHPDLSATLERTLAPLSDRDAPPRLVGHHHSRDPAGLPAALGRLALNDHALAARFLHTALAGKRDQDREAHPWPVLKGLFLHPETRDHLLVVLADALLRVPTAEPSTHWSQASRLCSLAGRDFHAALEHRLAPRLNESDDPARFAFRLVLLHEPHRWSGPLRAAPAIVDACLADPRPWLRASVLDRLGPHRIDRPPALSPAAIAAAIANLAAEDDPDHAHWPDESDGLGTRTRVQPSRVREQAFDLLRNARSDHDSAAAVDGALERVLEAPSATLRGWAAVLLAHSDPGHPELRPHLAAAVTASSIDLASAAAGRLLADPAPPTGDLRGRCHEALWLAHIHEFPRPHTPFTITDPPDDATIARILDRTDIDDHQDLAWFFTNPHAVERVCRRILAPSRDHEIVPRLILRALRSDPDITARLCDVIDATRPDQAVDLAWLLQLRVHDLSSEGPIDPRVLRAHDHCLDAVDPSVLAAPIEQLVWFGIGGPRLLAAIRRCLNDADLAVRCRVLDACIRHAGRALPKPVDPFTLRDAIAEARALAVDELLAALSACGASDDPHDRLDAGIFLLALGAPADAIHTALDPLAATHGAGHGDPDRCKWALSDPLLRAVGRISHLRCDHLAATLLQHLDGTPLPPHLRDEARAALRDPRPQSWYDSTSTWSLRVLLHDGGPAALEALVSIEAVLVSFTEDRLDRDEASRNREHVTRDALFACADHPAVADLWIRLALAHPRRGPHQLRWDHLPRILGKRTAPDALVAALCDRTTDHDHGVLAARVLAAVGHASDELLDHVLDHILSARAHESFEHSQDDAAVRLAVWPRLRTRWQAGALSPDHLARALAIATHDEIPAADLPALVESLLDTPLWRVRCPAVALCHARGLPVDSSRLLAALRVCIAFAPHLHGLVDAIKKNLDAVLPDLLCRRETTPDDEWEYHPLADLPALRPFQISRLLRRLDAASDEEPLHHLVDCLRALGVEEASLRARLLPRILTGERNISRFLLGPDRSWEHRGSPWIDPRAQTEPVRCGLLLAAHPDWADGATRERLAAALDGTPAALDALLADLTARPSDPDLLARARTLAEHRPDDSFLVRLARAWWFGRLPHETLAACEATPPTPSRQALVKALLDRSLPELRLLASRLSTPLDRDLPGGPASPREVAEVLAELAERRGLCDELAALLDELQRRRA